MPYGARGQAAGRDEDGNRYKADLHRAAATDDEDVLLGNAPRRPPVLSESLARPHRRRRERRSSNRRIGRGRRVDDAMQALAVEVHGKRALWLTKR